MKEEAECSLYFLPVHALDEPPARIMPRALFVDVVVLFFCFVVTGFLCVSLAVLELILYTRLTSNSRKFTCLYLPCAGIKGMTLQATKLGSFFYF